jgi:hypothetical protein
MMMAREETETFFMYCLEALRLLIEKPYMSDALVARPATSNNNMELLYKHELMKVR